MREPIVDKKRRWCNTEAPQCRRPVRISMHRSTAVLPNEGAYSSRRRRGTKRTSVRRWLKKRTQQCRIEQLRRSLPGTLKGAGSSSPSSSPRPLIAAAAAADAASAANPSSTTVESTPEAAGCAENKRCDGLLRTPPATTSVANRLPQKGARAADRGRRDPAAVTARAVVACSCRDDPQVDVLLVA